ncbi:NAD(P)/FAD-dependent oxidoreductase [Geodermatophilus sp. DSM 45219]|uniref:FAD-dependent oxidoreductase n=1 Tax=Geodermatophilus sp. DSM 45219 TaxID=1881103 RepID=UPI0008875579|nr:NAD(P)/FAD-dependent oxidoreductase [Geodermatophilus sp. DSM 45219]SDN74317.1 2-polyprenyl-6-methoxyphenol hydroxylase [Geodermatophilus sp. DSM 45219]
MRVVVIGAGIGGLALAQALHRAGVDVRVHDRDAAVSATGGYRLHLDATACAALRRHLRPAHYQAVLASSAGSGGFRQFAVTDHRLRPLLVAPQDPGEERLLIGRVPLRRLLAHGLDGRLFLGREFTHHRVDGDGTVTAHFADGSVDSADLLVGADGVGSRVARALAGRPTSAPVGISGIAGRTRLDPGTDRRVPEVLRAGPALAFAPGGVGAFLSLHDPLRAPAVDPATCREVPAIVEAPQLVWGLIAPDRLLPRDLRERSGAALAEVATDLLAGWSGDVRSVVGAADRDDLGAYRFHAADPDAELTPWPAGPVVCLGDAVHAMPPTGGMAAATAIRDADLLAGHLAAVRAGTSSLALAVHDHQRQMATYAPAAVRESLAPLRWIRAAGSPGGRLVARGLLPVAALAAGTHRALTGRGRPAPTDGTSGP